MLRVKSFCNTGIYDLFQFLILNFLSASHILTDTVEDDNSSIDGITYDRQHTRNKCISHRCSGNNIKRKYDQDIMKKCKYCTACKADILKTEPDVKKA